MSDHDPRLDVPIRREEDLLQVFREAEKPRERWLVGAEMEKFGVLSGGEPLNYDGEHGVLRVMQDLEKRGWTPARERADGPVIALTRSSSSITLEPGSQFELSGAPFDSVHALCAEIQNHFDELGPISKAMGARWLGLGFHPFARRADYTMVPKGRYAIMREYLPTRGGHALDMMLRTATVQANYDFSSEADAMRKMRVGLKLSPLTTAIFANSPFYEGKPFGGLTYRGQVWLDVDPDRSGLLPALFTEGAGYADYVAWALDAPMFVVKRGEAILPNTSQTFRAFWRDGRGAERATLADWQLHLNTLFPEVRLKNTIEIRGADSQGKAARCALPALWTGLFYDEESLSRADALTADFTHEDVSRSRADIALHGVRAEFRGKPLLALAQEVVALADAGLARRARKRADGRDERMHLDAIRALLERGMTPADALLEGLESAADPRAELMRRADLMG